MVLLQSLSDSAWEIRIKATDLSNRVLETASRGVWPAKSAREIPLPHLKIYILKGIRQHDGKIKARQELRSVIEFFRLNSKDASYPFNYRFDLIFCRNVLIYFDPKTRRQVVARLLSYLRPDGYLFLGHAEGIPQACAPVKMIIPTVYQLVEGWDGTDAISR